MIRNSHSLAFCFCCLLVFLLRCPFSFKLSDNLFFTALIVFTSLCIFFLTAVRFIMVFFFLAAPSTALTFLLHFVFASLSSSQLMTTNTQMVSPFSTVCYFMLDTVSCLAPLRILTSNHHPSTIDVQFLMFVSLSSS